jgi:hypothetical protein
VGRGLLGAEPTVQAPARGEKANVEEQGSDPGDGTTTSLEVDPGGEMVGQKIGRYKTTRPTEHTTGDLAAG